MQLSFSVIEEIKDLLQNITLVTLSIQISNKRSNPLPDLDTNLRLKYSCLLITEADVNICWFK